MTTVSSSMARNGYCVRVKRWCPTSPAWPSARRLSVGAFGDDACELEDPGRREVLFGDPHAEVSIVVGDVRRRLEVVDLDLGDLHRGRDQVVHERPRPGLPVLPVGDLLVEHGAHALRDATADLAFDDGRVDHLAAVLHDRVARNPHLAGFEIDLDPAHVRGLRPSPFTAVPVPVNPDGLTTAKPVGVADDTTPHSLLRDLAEGQRYRGDAGDVNGTVFDDDVFRRCLQQVLCYVDNVLAQ